MKQTISIPPVEQEWLYVPDVVYQTVNGVERKLQFIIPYRREWPAGLRLPVVVNIPGSAWYRQEMYNGILNHSHLAQRGFVMVDVQYRESTIAKFPAQIEDVKAALRFLPQVAEQFHMDMDNVFLMGDSSGAHTALMAAFTAAYGEFDLQPDQPTPGLRGVVAYYPPTDLRQYIHDDVFPDLLGTKGKPYDPELGARASCDTWVRADRTIPPVLMLHGTADEDVSIEHSRRLYHHLTTLGKDVTYIEVEGERHGGGTWWSEPIMDIVEEFLRKAGA